MYRCLRNEPSSKPTSRVIWNALSTRVFNYVCSVHKLYAFCMRVTIICVHERRIKESFDCKMRMPGTVKCRPTVAYWIQIDGINITTELITRYYSNETLIQCCFNVRSTSATLTQHWTNIGYMYNIWEKVLVNTSLGSSHFHIPAVIQSVWLQASDQVGSRAEGFELLTHRCRSSIYELAVIWELVPNEALGMKRRFSIIME